MILDLLEIVCRGEGPNNTHQMYELKPRGHAETTFERGAHGNNDAKCT